MTVGVSLVRLQFVADAVWMSRASHAQAVGRMPDAAFYFLEIRMETDPAAVGR